MNETRKMSTLDYQAIAEKIAASPQGAPTRDGKISPAFIDFLKVMYTPEQAKYVRLLEMDRQFLPQVADLSNYKTPSQLAKMTGDDPFEIKEIMDEAGRKGMIAGIILSDLQSPVRVSRMFKAMAQGMGRLGAMKAMADIVMLNVKERIALGMRNPVQLTPLSLYALPYSMLMVNAYQFKEEIGENDLQAARLHTEFFIEDQYYRNYESSKKGTAIWRSLPVEKAIDPGAPIKSFEEAYRVIDEQTSIAMVPCPCRSRREKLGIRECKDNNPIGVCLFLGMTAVAAESMGIGKYVTHTQAKSYVDDMMGMGLVCAGANWSGPPNAVICMCCECCCSQTRGRTRWDNPDAITPSNFIPASGEECVYCGKCAKKCMFNAITVDKKEKTFHVEPDECIGCGVCAVACPTGALQLKRYERSRQPETARHLYEILKCENK